MRITHVVPHIDREASGPSYSVPRLCQSLAECENSVELKCLAAKGPIPGVELTIHRQWPVLSRFAISTDMARALRREARQVDIVHNHSLWSMVNVAAGCAVPGHHAKLVTSPRGTLSPRAFARSKHRKQILWPIQKRALTRADLLHATCEAEYNDIRRLGLRAPVAVIPNGIDPPPEPPPKPAHPLRTLLYLGRIHPIKGIDNLLHAWLQLEQLHPTWRLVIAGTGEPQHVADVTNLARSLGVRRVEFAGPVYGNDKTTAYFSADLFVLPTHTENFGMVVAEALAHGLPAIVSRGAPWSGLETEDCGWWVDDNVAALRAAMDKAMRLQPAQLAEMGVNGRGWMARDFSWGSVAHRMTEAYRWIVRGGDCPAWVRCG